ncbi:GNAT family N-acetyltransferase [Intrasporangium sp.]|uniref:GNAT family N-acetyltransferase n=1 Tax=Intrasporangium sp. TaxID=1925024 RepID=UPI0032217464
MRRLCERPHPPGVVAYRAGRPAGWCSIGPRAEITRLVRSRLIRPVDDLPVWSIVCVVVRPGHRRQGVTGPRAIHGRRAPTSSPILLLGSESLTPTTVLDSLAARPGARTRSEAYDRSVGIA